jgi:hypothetical protein
MQRGETGRRGALAAFQPTDEQRHIVMVFSANGATREIIADALSISAPTLDKYFKKEMKIGRERVTARVGFVLVREALAGNMGAARYWLDRRGGEAWAPREGAPQIPYEDDDTAEQRVHFYLPENHRDKPEPVITIDGEVERDDEAA